MDKKERQRKMDRQKHVEMDRLTKRLTEKEKDELTVGLKEEHTERQKAKCIKIERNTDIKSERWTGRQKNRQRLKDKEK